MTLAYVPTMVSGTLEGDRIGAAWLEREREHAVGQPLVVVPTARHIRRDRYIEQLTERTAWVTAGRARLLRMMGWHGGPTLLVHPDVATVGRFDGHRAVTSLCVIEGHDYDPTAWARARGAQDLTVGATVAHDPTIDPNVAAAIEDARAVSGWRGLTTRIDRARIGAVLEATQPSAGGVDPVDLETWALACGWRPSVALRLRRLAETIALSGRPRRDIDPDGVAVAA